MGSKITGEEIISVLDNSEYNAQLLEEVADKYLGITESGTFPTEIIQAFEKVGRAGAVASASPAESFAAGFVAALKILDEKF